MPRAQPHRAGPSTRAGSPAGPGRDGDLGRRSRRWRHRAPASRATSELPGQFGLGHPGGRPHHADRLRRGHVLAAGDVDDAEHRAWVDGSWIGAAAHVQGWTERLKCSAARIWTGASRRSAVPGALVPAFPRPTRALDEVDLLRPGAARRAGRTPTAAGRRRRRRPSRCRTPRQRGRARRTAAGRRGTAGARPGSRRAGHRERDRAAGWPRHYARRRRPEPRVGDQPADAPRG